MKPRVPFSDEIAHRLIVGLTDGVGLRILCRQPGMPTRPTVLRWLRARPDFRACVEGARIYAGLFPRKGLPRGYPDDTADRIYDRLCQGEPLRTICRDPDMPSRSAVHTWMQADPEFREDVALARWFAGWAEAERQWAAWGYGRY